MARKKKTEKSPFIVKFVLISLLAAGISGAAGCGIVYLFRHNDYFKVRSVVIDPSLQFVNKQDLKGLLGKNIFDIDLKMVQRKLSYKYSQASDLKVTKLFPNQIAVVAKQRFPFAQMRVEDKTVILDDQSVVISIEEQPDKKLPAVTGAKPYNQKIVRGLPWGGADVDVALKIVKSFQEEKSLASYTITQVNIENLSKIYFTLSNGLDVILDRGNNTQRAKILGVVLSQGQLDLKQAKYVDLRFKEPIIGKK